MGGLFGSVKGEQYMSQSEDIRWKVYRQMPKFFLLEAAFLWLEIVPRKEELESPPHFVEAQKKILNDAIFQYYLRRMAEGLKLRAKPGLSDTEIIDEYMRSDGPYHLLVKMGLDEHHDDREEQIGRISYTLADRYYERLRPKEYEAVSSDTLKEIAKILNERPKFLFLEARDQENNGWNKGEVSKPSYQDLIKILLNELKLDLNDSDTVGKIEALAQKHQIAMGLEKTIISRRTIETIRNEIKPSRASTPKNAK
jgi:hypothetical protein